MRENRILDLRILARGISAVALAVLAAGCSSIHDHRGYLIDQALTDSVQPGVDNRLSVERSLGQPTFKSQFGQQAWYYVSIDTKQAPFTRPRTSAETILKINFDPAGNVASFRPRSGVTCGSASSTERTAARAPAASPSKHSTGTGDSRHNTSRCSSVSAVPSGATAAVNPA